MFLPSTKNSVHVDLTSYDNAWYSPGASFIKRCGWYFINGLFVNNSLNPLSSVRIFWLRAFGAKIGKGVVLKPSIHIKYPWLLEIGHHVWIGEHVWIDNLSKVVIEDHVALSQGAMLLTGSHDYTKPTFDLLLGQIHLQPGVWIGAKSIVCPGVTCHSHSVLAAGSVATKDLDAYWIYQGNPAEKKRQRMVKE